MRFMEEENKTWKRMGEPPAVRMSRVEASRAHPTNFEFHPEHKKKIVASPKDAWKEEEEEEDREEGFRERIVRRAVRKYPEDAGDHVEAGHRQISIPMGRAEGSCPEVLAKGTLAVIVAALAFLGFFSTSVLLVVAVCVLRMVEKQRKTGKDGKTSYPSRRPLPPIPPPRPERTYMTMKPHGSDRLCPATPHTTEDAYLSVNELNPGPRTRQNLHYQNPGASSPPKVYLLFKSREQIPRLGLGSFWQMPLEVAKHWSRGPAEPQPLQSAPLPPWLLQSFPSAFRTPVEREYIIPEKVQPFSSPPSAKKYVNVEESEPTTVTGGSPEIGMTPRERDNHIYEEVE